MRRMGLNETELAQRLVELEIQKRQTEAERLQLELARQKQTNGDNKPGGPQIIIKLVNSPDGD